ncbi:MAG: extracellular solute-binding protein [Betaproteobacteria bacterium]|nr:extracellular solute-binding protein [Betaproteobacteria bacterium]MBI3935510.1 extracellular solute-binding protein [Betaproteobacteria bacterium]
MYPARSFTAALFGFGLLAAAAHAQQQVVIVTSFPKELTAAYKKAFEARNPGINVEILNKPTPAGLAYVREAPPANKPDVFWASAPDAFEVMARENLLARATDLANPAVPRKIGNYPINDPKGYYLGQALAGYGIMWNTRYMKANKLPEPREWVDLVKPVYSGHVAMSSPSRSGTTHLTVETILQGEGWTKGWRQMLMIAGNSAAITERSFGVPDGVNNGQYGLGLVIDFFGLAAIASGFPAGFVYPSMTAIVPANIGLIAGARNAANARRFIAFTLSPEGQELLFDPKISRLPVVPGVYAKAPKGFPNPFAGTIKPKVNFDSELSESRYYLVSAMFDQTITFRHKELVAATRAIHEAAARLAGKPNARAQKLLDEARQYAYTPVVSEDKAKDKEFLGIFRATKRDAAKVKKMTVLEEYWNSEARKNYAKAVEIAKQATALAK